MITKYVAVAALHILFLPVYEPQTDKSNNVVCGTSKASDQPARMGSLIRAFASRLNMQ